jgi:hypothetical protein
MYASIDKVSDKIERQIMSAKGSVSAKKTGGARASLKLLPDVGEDCPRGPRSGAARRRPTARRAHDTSQATTGVRGAPFSVYCLSHREAPHAPQ